MTRKLLNADGRAYRQLQFLCYLLLRIKAAQTLAGLGPSQTLEFGNITKTMLAFLPPPPHLPTVSRSQPDSYPKEKPNVLKSEFASMSSLSPFFWKLTSWSHVSDVLKGESRQAGWYFF